MSRPIVHFSLMFQEVATIRKTRNQLIVSAYLISRGVRDHVEKRPFSKEVSFGSDGRAMGHRGTADPTCQAEPTRRTPSSGRDARSPQYHILPEPERLPMGDVAP